MKYTKKLVLRLDKISQKTNEAPLCLRIIINRETTYRKIININPVYWDSENKQVKKQYPNATELNAFITSQVAEIERSILELNAIKKVENISVVRNKLQNKSSLDYFEYADKYILNLMNNGNYGTGKRYKTVITKFKAFHDKKTLPINSISIDLIKRYENYLQTTLGNRTNTITSNLKVLSKLLGDIYRENNFNEADNPFKKIKFKSEPTNRETCTIEEIKKIEDKRIRPRNASLFDAKQIFLFECFSGMRIADILTLKWKYCRENEIVTVMRKTKKQHIYYINHEIKKILDFRSGVITNQGYQINPEKYVFNILKVDVEKCTSEEAINEINRATAKINKQLKNLARILNINKNLSTHIGRHSFATILLTKGVDIYTIKELLGHSNIATTQIYAKVMEENKRKAVNLLNN